jgi:hypothetical protein
LGELDPLFLVGGSKSALDRPIHTPLEANGLRRGLLGQPDLMPQVGENESIFPYWYEIGHANAQHFSGRGKVSGRGGNLAGLPCADGSGADTGEKGKLAEA